MVAKLGGEHGRNGGGSTGVGHHEIWSSCKEASAIRGLKVRVNLRRL